MNGVAKVKSAQA